MISEKDIRQIAGLAKVEFSEDELVKFTAEFNAVLNYVEQLKEVEVTGVEPMSHVHGITNVFRDDETLRTMDDSAVFSNAPDFTPANYFKVPIIIDRSGEH